MCRGNRSFSVSLYKKKLSQLYGKCIHIFNFGVVLPLRGWVTNEIKLVNIILCSRVVQLSVLQLTTFIMKGKINTLPFLPPQCSSQK